MRDVVERVAHAPHQAFETREQRVDAGPEPIERILRAAGRDARLEPARVEDGVGRGFEGAHRGQRQVGDEGAADDGDDGDDQADFERPGPEVGQDVVADARAAADLHGDALRQPAGADLELAAVDRVGDGNPAGARRGAVVERGEVEAAPAGRLREVDDLGLVVGDADEQPLVAAFALVGVDQRPQSAQPGALVGDAVALEHRLEHVAILRRERPAEQQVGEGEQHGGAEREQAGVPQAQPQRQRGAKPVTPP